MFFHMNQSRNARYCGSDEFFFCFEEENEEELVLALKYLDLSEGKQWPLFKTTIEMTTVNAVFIQFGVS